MSTVPENEFDLEKLFLPAWAQEPSSAKQYAKYEGVPDRSDRDRRPERRGPRPPQRGGGPGGPGGRRQDSRGPGGRRPEGDRPREARPDRFGPRSHEERERRPLPRPLPEIEVSLVPDDKGVESLSRQIKMTGRAYPLFDIAQMILQKPERHSVSFKIKKNAEGQPIQPLFLCALDDSLWLSESEAIEHVLRKHFATFYQAERSPTDPPKGKYTFVAQCGMSGTILGPPNYHDYQNQLRKLHTERYSRIPFEEYKARVKIVRDEEVVKKWVDDQSFKTEYVCLNLPEPLKLPNMEAVEKHFRDVHKDNIIKSVESFSMGGATARNLRSQELLRCVRSVWEDQRRFPLQIATVLSQQFASNGLQFFKVNKTVTHVSVARPHYLDLEATPVSDGVKRIVEFINHHSKCNRRDLVEALEPSPIVTPPAAPVSTEGAPAAAAESNQPTPEQTSVIADLHWLVHQGHVIEFANGILENAKRPLPKPPRPEPKAKTVEAAPVAENASAVPGREAPAINTDDSNGSAPVVAPETTTPPAAASFSPAGEPPSEAPSGETSLSHTPPGEKPVPPHGGEPVESNS